MGDTVDTAAHTLIVSGPERDRLYEHFLQLFRGRDDVVVVKDRRYGERRRRRAAIHPERRGGERRRREPDWIVPEA